MSAKRTKSPSADDLCLAAEWLDQYEAIDASDSDQEGCERVAEWLRSQADKKNFRATCKSFGISTSVARMQLLNAATKTKEPCRG